MRGSTVHAYGLHVHTHVSTCMWTTCTHMHVSNRVHMNHLLVLECALTPGIVIILILPCKLIPLMNRTPHSIPHPPHATLSTCHTLHMPYTPHATPSTCHTLHMPYTPHATPSTCHTPHMPHPPHATPSTCKSSVHSKGIIIIIGIITPLSGVK